MVEPYLVPAVRLVAILAFAAVITAMNVIDRVTGDALQRRLLISLVDVTAFAVGVGVFASECEVGAVVVELDSSPFVRDMAGCTVLAEAATVRVALAMAVRTARRCFLVGFVRHVTCIACRFRMRSLERKVGLLVIEDFGIKPDYVCISAFMLGVTAGTGKPFEIPDTTMKAALGIDVCSYLLMAVETQTVLQGSAEWLVAALAIFLFIGMSMMNGTWH